MIEDVYEVNNWESLETHELCLLFPEMIDDEYKSLIDSMKLHGFFKSDPIVLIDTDPESGDPHWEILDGRNRHLAAMDAGVMPIFVEYTGNNPIGYVIGRNLDRRHLTTGQKAAVASSLSNLVSGQNASAGEITQSEAADQVRVGEASVRRYNYVEKHDPILAERVKSGEVSLEKARVIVTKTLTEEQEPEVDMEDIEELEKAVEELENEPPELMVTPQYKLSQEAEVMSETNSIVERLILKHSLLPSVNLRAALWEAYSDGCNHGKQ